MVKLVTQSDFIANQKAHFDDWCRIIDVLATMKKTRQIAYNNAKDTPALAPWFERANDAYLELCETIEVTPEAVFDNQAHIAKMIAAGDRLYTEAYK